MDAKKLEEIKAAHEAAKGEMPACSVGLDAHKHRGILLDAIAEAQAAEKAAHPLRIVSTQIADSPGGVRTVIEASTVLRDATAEEQRVIERIPEVHTMIDAGKLDEADALLDEIERVMGRGFVETAGMRATVHFERPAPVEWATVNPQVATLPDGTMVVLPTGTMMRDASAEDIAAAHEQRREAAPAVFAPTPEEVASCAVLAEVAGRPLREAVLVLARRVTSARLTNEELSKANGTLREEVERAQKQAMSFPALSRPQRPRVGPWVENGVLLSRYDGCGHRVAEVSYNVHADTWGGWANVAFGATVVVRPGTREEVTRAVDAILATWADLDGAPRETLPDALTQARTLLRRVRLRLGGHPKDGNAASVAHDVQMVDEIDAFLAGLPVASVTIESDPAHGGIRRWSVGS